MREYDSITLEPEADVTVVAALSRILGPAFRRALNSRDLAQRLAKKGFGIHKGYLVTAPQGKLVCPISQI